MRPSRCWRKIPAQRRFHSAELLAFRAAGHQLAVRTFKNLRLLWTAVTGRTVSLLWSHAKIDRMRPKFFGRS
jgi:hypothetical protein